VSFPLAVLAGLVREEGSTTEGRAVSAAVSSAPVGPAPAEEAR
jgi:hypothetical protein